MDGPGTVPPDVMAKYEALQAGQQNQQVVSPEEQFARDWHDTQAVYDAAGRGEKIFQPKGNIRPMRPAPAEPTREQKMRSMAHRRGFDPLAASKELIGFVMTNSGLDHSADNLEAEQARLAAKGIRAHVNGWYAPPPQAEAPEAQPAVAPDVDEDVDAWIAEQEADQIGAPE